MPALWGVQTTQLSWASQSDEPQEKRLLFNIHPHSKKKKSSIFLFVSNKTRFLVKIIVNFDFDG